MQFSLGILRLHVKIEQESMKENEMNALARAYYGVLLFDPREDVVNDSLKICIIMAKWGLTVCTRGKEKGPKLK